MLPRISIKRRNTRREKSKLVKMDPIADYLTRIRNVINLKKKVVKVPFSKIKVEISRILMEEGFISNFKVENNSREMLIYLKYGPKGESVIRGLKRISKPSRRVYVKWEEIPKVKDGLGVALLSTPKGIMSDKEAREKKIGGELLCEVW